MNPQFQPQDLQQQQLQGIPVNLLKVQQYQQQQQQQQLLNSQLLQQQYIKIYHYLIILLNFKKRLLQRQQRQLYTQQQQQVLLQNQQLPLQLQLQQQYQQQQLQRIQLMQKQKQAQQGILVGQSPLDQAALSNQLLLQVQQNQLLQSQQSPILQPTVPGQLTPHQLPQSLLLDAHKKNIAASQQLLQNSTLVPTNIVSQSPTFNAKQTLIQQQLAQQKLKLINQSPVQSQGTLKSSTPPTKAQTKLPTSTVATTLKTTSITTPSTKPPTAAQIQVAELQSQLSKQASLVQLPTSSINIESFTNAASVLNVPTSTTALVTSNPTTATSLTATSLALTTVATSLDSLAKTYPLTTTTTVPLPTSSTQTTLTTQMSPLNKSQTSLGLQLSQAQLQSHLARQIKTNQKSPPLKAQINVPTPTLTSKTQLKSVNQIKKSTAKQTSPTSSLTQASPVSVATSKLTTITQASPVKMATNKINSITQASPVNVATNKLSTTNPNTNLQNYQSLIQLQTPQQQQQQNLNLAQAQAALANPQLQISSKNLNLKSELEQLSNSLTSSNDLLLSGLTRNNPTTTISATTNKLSKTTPTTTINNNTNVTTIEKPNSIKVEDSTSNVLTSALSFDTNLKSNQLLTKSEPITHININYSGNDDVKLPLSDNLSNIFNINKTSADAPSINSIVGNSLINPIYGQQPSSLNEKIISKGSLLLKCQKLFSILRNENKGLDILFWKQYTNNFFSDKAKMIIDLQKIKTIELKRSIIPQYFDVIAKSEINSTSISFGFVDEKYLGDGTCILEGKECILIYGYTDLQINWYGNLKTTFNKEGKIEIFEFVVKNIKKFYESNSNYLNGNYPAVNEYGMPTTVKRFFEIYEVVNKMDDLMNCSISWNVGPKMALNQYANKYRQDLKTNSLTLNQQINNLKLNNIDINSPLLSLSNSNSSATADEIRLAADELRLEKAAAAAAANLQNYNTLLNLNTVPSQPQIPSTSNSSNLNSVSDTITNALNKKRLASTVTATTLSPPINNLNAINVGTNSVTVSSNNSLKLTSALSPVSSSIGLNLPTSSVLTGLTASSINLATNPVVSSAANNLISAVNNLANTTINPTSVIQSPMSTLISPLQMDLVSEPKAKKAKTNPSPRQRKPKGTKRRNSSNNNSSTISS
ncbi:hypothetical protein BCR32DRAFT_249043 [Anaeromyces robustus]|uniref:Uncharacterized protein n=1 Tax=Anaeromyces robustus TaxID=1754192 RepID=A0A1Y1WR90_9FUNG|nr:hypothetical protein BCR32DRAFT_249043 [Anaeromyces robustus]|eukprot:ORX76063.1 hypothetical protein BCR32DRAFT_249043 [Anaeromyces robustus]